MEITLLDPIPPLEHASSREAAFLASVARGAISILEKGNSARPVGAVPGGVRAAIESDAEREPKTRD
jgi:hypothetical protein